MSKPDWKNAPEWANYLAMDECGAWWWYDPMSDFKKTVTISIKNVASNKDAFGVFNDVDESNLTFEKTYDDCVSWVKVMQDIQKAVECDYGYKFDDYGCNEDE